jgi:hypothetical protein
LIIEMAFDNYSGTSALDVRLASILSYVQSVHAQNVQQHQLTMAANHRLEALEAIVKSMQMTLHQKAIGDAPAEETTSNDSRKCPLCHLHMQHAKSFKGHIRRLVVVSSRPRCHLNVQDPEHHNLVHRFVGSDFYQKSHNFCRSFYGFVRGAISAAYEPEESLVLVRTWLAACTSTNGDPFPECKGVTDSSGSGDSRGTL